MRLAQAGDEDERNYYRERLAVLEPVPFAPPENFRQGLQALWFAFAFVRLCGNWPGIGRIDAMLGPLCLLYTSCPPRCAGSTNASAG